MANVRESPRREEGRSRDHLYADDPRGGYAMLACSRIGAIHSVIFGGFSPDSIAGRVQDCDSHVIITADEGLRGGKIVPLKQNVDIALTQCPGRENRHRGQAHGSQGADARRPGRGLYGGPRRGLGRVPAGADGRRGPAVHPQHLGLDGQAEGGVAHYRRIPDLGVRGRTSWCSTPWPERNRWCTADIGWVTGHSYIVYGPMANQEPTTLIFEGDAQPSDHQPVLGGESTSTRWRFSPPRRQDHCVLMRDGDAPVQKTSRKSLRLLGSVGEPINPEAWLWYHRVVGEGRCRCRRHPVADRGQGACLVSPLPGATPLKPGSASKPLPGVKLQIVDAEGKVLEGCRRAAI